MCFHSFVHGDDGDAAQPPFGLTDRRSKKVGNPLEYDHSIPKIWPTIPRKSLKPVHYRGTFSVPLGPYSSNFPLGFSRGVPELGGAFSPMRIISYDR